MKSQWYINYIMTIPMTCPFFMFFFFFVWFNQLNPLAFLESWPFSLMLEVDTPRRERDHYRIDHQKNVEDGFFQGDDISYTSCIYIYHIYHHIIMKQTELWTCSTMFLRPPRTRFASPVSHHQIFIRPGGEVYILNGSTGSREKPWKIPYKWRY